MRAALSAGLACALTIAGPRAARAAAPCAPEASRIEVTIEGDARLAPTRIGADDDWASVAAGRFHTCALKRDRRVLCAGQNDVGQLGLGDVTSRFTFTLVVLPPG